MVPDLAVGKWSITGAYSIYTIYKWIFHIEPYNPCIYIYKDIPYIAEVTPKWFINLVSMCSHYDFESVTKWDDPLKVEIWLGC